MIYCKASTAAGRAAGHNLPCSWPAAHGGTGQRISTANRNHTAVYKCFTRARWHRSPCTRLLSPSAPCSWPDPQQSRPRASSAPPLCPARPLRSPPQQLLPSALTRHMARSARAGTGNEDGTNCVTEPALNNSNSGSRTELRSKL